MHRFPKWFVLRLLWIERCVGARVFDHRRGGFPRGVQQCFGVRFLTGLFLCAVLAVALSVLAGDTARMANTLRDKQSNTRTKLFIATPTLATGTIDCRCRKCRSKRWRAMVERGSTSPRQRCVVGCAPLFAANRRNRCIRLGKY